jgi:hypothetical protein
MIVRLFDVERPHDGRIAIGLIAVNVVEGLSQRAIGGTFWIHHSLLCRPYRDRRRQRQAANAPSYLADGRLCLPYNQAWLAPGIVHQQEGPPG